MISELKWARKVQENVAAGKDPCFQVSCSDCHHAECVGNFGRYSNPNGIKVGETIQWKTIDNVELNYGSGKVTKIKKNIATLDDGVEVNLAVTVGNSGQFFLKTNK